MARPVRELRGQRLHAEGFDHRPLDDDWWGRLNRHSLGWVTACRGGDLVEFVDVAWGGARAAGCEWLHVDFDDHLTPFCFESCGFQPTNAGLIAL